MIDKILSIYEKSDFDFRKYAYPEDPLAYLFERWVDYYKMKYAICKAINPSSILEVGVRYGYSCMAFLEAVPRASYLGIDADRDSFGGVEGALEWAKESAKSYDALFLTEDTQLLTDFPGEEYDLIHIDGQQDGDGTFHDLEMAVRKAKYLLLDGFYWSRKNMLSSVFFTEKYRKIIEYALVVPGYAGDFLIKIASSKRCLVKDRLLNKQLAPSYTDDYYLDNSSGYEAFLKMRHAKNSSLLDGRLKAILSLVCPQKGERILDVGCSRGELAYAMSACGAVVTGIGYSEAAIALARETFQDFPKKGSLDFMYGDFHSTDLEKGTFDKIIASDVVEHLDPQAFLDFLKEVKALLQEKGVFFVHTSPNKLMYASVYKEKRESAASVGLYLPRNPRTLYEDLMHINEQTPAQLRRALRKVFSQCYVWVAQGLDASQGLAGKMSWREVRESPSVFAVAGKIPINMNALLDNVRQLPLNRENLAFTLNLPYPPECLSRASTANIPLLIKNNSNQSIGSYPPFPVHVAYHWKNEKSEMLVFDGLRSVISPKFLPGEEREMLINVLTPSEPGKYVLGISLVQESCFWFEEIRPDILKAIIVHVV